MTEPDVTLASIARQLAALEDHHNRVELRLERLDAKLDGLEKRLASLEGRLETRFDGLETRVNTKAGNWVVSLWGATLAVLIALLTLWRP
jgi:tetrahydromethanopterin S-methyltransferase subunit G